MFGHPVRNAPAFYWQRELVPDLPNYANVSPPTIWKTQEQRTVLLAKTGCCLIKITQSAGFALWNWSLLISLALIIHRKSSAAVLRRWHYTLLFSAWELFKVQLFSLCSPTQATFSQSVHTSLTAKVRWTEQAFTVVLITKSVSVWVILPFPLYKDAVSSYSQGSGWSMVSQVFCRMIAVCHCPWLSFKTHCKSMLFEKHCSADDS